MNRLFYAFTLLALLFAVSCGGGTTTLAPGDTSPEQPAPGQQLLVDPIAPSSVVGDHSVSIVPGQLSVVTGTDEQGMVAIAAKYGYSVLRQDGSEATLEIPLDADVEAAARQLAKEFNIVSAQPVQRINTPAVNYSTNVLKDASFIPLDPMYGDQLVSFSFDGTSGSYVLYPGQASVMSYMGFPGAWDLSRTTQVGEEPVVIAIIDGGWFDYTAPADRSGFDETLIDEANSGFVASDGTFTPGLTAATWEIGDLDGDPGTRGLPYRTQGELLLGIIAADQNATEPRAFDFDGDTIITEDEIWNDGIAGINPNASLLLIKTGEVSGTSWSFTDNHVAESIDHAVAAGANIVVCGFFGLGAVSANVSAALQNARDNDVLVLAPAGDVIDSINFETDPPSFDDAPVDITVTPVTPASDPNCLSVTGTGFDRVEAGALPDLDFGGGPVPNTGRGWYFGFNEPFEGDFFNVTDYCNTGADIAAVGYAIGFGYHPNFGTGNPEPDHLDMGDTYTATVDSFGSVQALGYVAGAASIVFQALSDANGMPPTAGELETALLDAGAVDFSPLDGTDNGGFLNASKAIYGAFGGGVVYSPGMSFTGVFLSQPLAAVTRGTDLVATPAIADGTGPFSLEVDWGTGEAPVVVDPWLNGDPITLVDGYDNLGLAAINVTVTDATGQEANIGFEIHVINPLAVTISVSDVEGVGVILANLQAGTQYRFSANASNVYTGEIDGVPNTTTFKWYFEGLADPIPFPLPAEDATGPSPVFAFPTPGAYDLTLVVEEDVRPNSIFRVSVTVN